MTAPIAEPLISKTKKGRELPRRQAYDRADLQKSLKKRGRTPVIPKRCNRKKPFGFAKKAYEIAIWPETPSDG